MQIRNSASAMAREMKRARLMGMFPLFWLVLAALACMQANPNPVIYVTATIITPIPVITGGAPTLRNPFIPTPTPNVPTMTPIHPTPNPTYPPQTGTTKYTVQQGDTLAAIADAFGVTVQQIIEMNPPLATSNVIFPGQQLTMPNLPAQATPSFKLIPDSEMVNSPGAIGFDIGAYVKYQPGFIRVYSEVILGRAMSGVEIVDFVATNTSVNPRLLLALLEYRGGWISNPVPRDDQIDYPLGFKDDKQKGLFKQLNWAANTLNAGYYGYKHRGIRTVQLGDKTRLAYAPDLNPGTIAVQYFLSRTTDRAGWLQDISPQGFFQTYMSMFGDPFRYAIEPLVPADLKQPSLDFPFPKGELWYFTGGPHGGWDSNSGWSAIDFAPPRPPDDILVAQGQCYVSPNWATAMTGGLVTRSGDGAVVIDTNMDGDERTGWSILYLHIADTDRIKEKTVVQPGDQIGHPSCEGFYLNAAATHLHIARKYNGEWIPADCWACAPSVPTPPFIIDGWTVKGYPGQIYQGWMEKNGTVHRAEQGRDDPSNQIIW